MGVKYLKTLFLKVYVEITNDSIIEKDASEKVCFLNICSTSVTLQQIIPFQ